MAPDAASLIENLDPPSLFRNVPHRVDRRAQQCETVGAFSLLTDKKNLYLGFHVHLLAAVTRLRERQVTVAIEIDRSDRL